MLGFPVGCNVNGKNITFRIIISASVEIFNEINIKVLVFFFNMYDLLRKGFLKIARPL